MRSDNSKNRERVQGGRAVYLLCFRFNNREVTFLVCYLGKTFQFKCPYLSAT
jgi:hypothetical protein